MEDGNFTGDGWIKTGQDTDFDRVAVDAESVVGMARRRVVLDDEKKALARRTKEVQSELDSIETRMADTLTGLGIDSIRVDGILHYLQQKTWVKGGNKEAAIDWLYEQGMRDCLMLGTQRLTALAKEDEAFLKELVDTGFFIADPVVKVGIRRS